MQNSKSGISNENNIIRRLQDPTSRKLSLIGGFFFPALHLDFVLFPALCIAYVYYVLQLVLLVCVKLYPPVSVR